MWFVLWAFLFILAEVILFVVKIPLSKKHSKVLFAVFFVLKLILVPGLALFAVALDSWFGWHFVLPLTALHISFAGDLIADLVALVIFLIRRKYFNLKFAAFLSFVFSAGIFIYGTVNMQVVKPDYHTYSSEKIKTEHKFVFLADLHVGSSQSFKSLVKATEKIKENNPDFIVLVGDVVDEFTKKDEMQKTFELFGSLDIPVYYVYGNHDRQETSKFIKNFHFTNKELSDTIESNGIKILRDEFTTISDDLVLLGREDASAGENRAVATELKNPKPEAYFINADHQPYQTQDIIDTNADLQISGHTHAGQLAPLNFIYMKILKLRSFGDFDLGNTHIYVTPGESGWKVPFRTDKYCAFEVVTLVPQA
jgi:uncharacterized protein